MQNGATPDQKPVLKFLNTLFESIEANEGELSPQALIDKISLAAILSAAQDAQEINALISERKQSIIDKLSRTAASTSSPSGTTMLATASAAYAIRTQGIPAVTKVLAEKGIPFAITFIPGVGPIIAPLLGPAFEFSAELGLHLLGKYCERIETGSLPTTLPQTFTRQFQAGFNRVQNSFNSLVPIRLRAQPQQAAASTIAAPTASETSIATLAATEVSSPAKRQRPDQR